MMVHQDGEATARGRTAIIVRLIILQPLVGPVYCSAGSRDACAFSYGLEAFSDQRIFCGIVPVLELRSAGIFAHAPLVVCQTSHLVCRSIPFDEAFFRVYVA